MEREPTEERIPYDKLPPKKIGELVVVRTAWLQDYGYDRFIEEMRDYIQTRRIE